MPTSHRAGLCPRRAAPEGVTGNGLQRSSVHESTSLSSQEPSCPLAQGTPPTVSRLTVVLRCRPQLPILISL